MFCFDKMKNLASYKSKWNKMVLMLSFSHECSTISENGRPDMVIHYNKTKSRVDTFDQLCSNMGCNRKTRRWPLCVFFGMVNIATINSYVIYCYNKYRTNDKSLSRYHYMIELSKSLAEPWLTIPNLRRTIRQNICRVLNIQ